MYTNAFYAMAQKKIHKQEFNVLFKNDHIAPRFFVP